ncbi:GNAT family N-acetyltransferase [Veronia nyctiphanis]|uniref:GNAT family N-acetyltransferase n=1 Tax=Veronia nyctiphanis TaxID=1278244 RepID=A0A4Q0YQG1_9GAMM|nr:GNAT family N-acetyltransferase [Veronia nyctiphanis]RXJ73266.1 GNAT family N-acetyltransferase [Veronia nyctiphanis]
MSQKNAENIIFTQNLVIEDAKALLAFEEANKAWFAEQIGGRPCHFFRIDAIKEHIEELLCLHALGKCLPMVIKSQSGEILGRVNLRDITDRDAELGYRIAKKHIRKGLASLAVKTMAQEATERRHTALIANVGTDNLGSQRVLENTGFVRGERIEAYTSLNGLPLDVYRYRLTLPAPAKNKGVHDNKG